MNKSSSGFMIMHPNSTTNVDLSRYSTLDSSCTNPNSNNDAFSQIRKNFKLLSEKNSIPQPYGGAITSNSNHQNNFDLGSSLDEYSRQSNSLSNNSGRLSFSGNQISDAQNNFSNLQRLNPKPQSRENSSSRPSVNSDKDFENRVLENLRANNEQILKSGASVHLSAVSHTLENNSQLSQLNTEASDLSFTNNTSNNNNNMNLQNTIQNNNGISNSKSGKEYINNFQSNFNSFNNNIPATSNNRSVQSNSVMTGGGYSDVNSLDVNNINNLSALNNSGITTTSVPKSSNYNEINKSQLTQQETPTKESFLSPSFNNSNIEEISSDFRNFQHGANPLSSSMRNNSLRSTSQFPSASEMSQNSGNEKSQTSGPQQQLHNVLNATLKANNRPGEQFNQVQHQSQLCDDLFMVRETFGDQVFTNRTNSSTHIDNTLQVNILNTSSASMGNNLNNSERGNHNMQSSALPPKVLNPRSIQQLTNNSTNINQSSASSQRYAHQQQASQQNFMENSKIQVNSNGNFKNSDIDKENNCVVARVGRELEQSDQGNFKLLNSSRDNMLRSNSPSAASISWNDSNSPAIAGAIQTLQEKNKQLQAEYNNLKQSLSEKEKSQQTEINLIKESYEQKLDQERGKDSGIKHKLFELNEETVRMQHQVTRGLNERQRLQKENEFLKQELEKIKFEFSDFNKQVIYLQKCNEILEDEKRKHIEQNSIEKEEYEQKITTFEQIRAAEQVLIARLEADISQTAQSQSSAEQRAIKAENDLQILKKNFTHFKQEVATRERQLIMKMQGKERETEELRDHLQKQRNSNKNRQAKMGNYEEKLVHTKDENSELRKQIQTLHLEITHLQQNQQQSEKATRRAENDKKNYQDMVRQLKSINQEIAQKVLQEISNQYVKENLSSLFSRSRRIEDLNNHEQSGGESATTRHNSTIITSSIRATSSSGQKSGQQKSATKKTTTSRNAESRSPTRSSSSSHKYQNHHYRLYSQPGLDLDDLIDSPQQQALTSFQHSMRPKYSLGGAANSGTANKSQNHSITSLLNTESDGQTPQGVGQKYIGTQKQKSSLKQQKSSTGAISGQSLDQSNRSLDQSRSLSRTRPSESQVFPQKSMDAESSRTLSQFNTLQQQFGDSTGRKNLLSSLGYAADRNNNQDISNEIFKLERVTTDLKREYANLQGQVDVEDSDNSDNLRNRMNEIAADLQNQTQELVSLQKQQKEIIISKVKSE